MSICLMCGHDHNKKPPAKPTEGVCNCTGPFTQSVHELNAEGHQVGCPRWGIGYADFARQHLPAAPKDADTEGDA